MFAFSHACPRCQADVSLSARSCRACGTPIATDPRAAATESRPPVWITTENYHPLADWGRRHRAQDAPLGAFLLGEISRAVVCAPEWIAPDVVTMNARVAYSVGEGRRTETRRLVFPDRHAPTGDTVSVLSPLGAALIGLAAGSGMTVRDRQGEAITVRVERVVYQPEAARRPPHPAA